MNPSEAGFHYEGLDALKNTKQKQESIEDHIPTSYSAEQRDKLKKIYEQIEKLETKADILKAQEKVTGNTAKYLYKALKKDPDINSKDAIPTKEMFQHYKSQYEQAIKEGGGVILKLESLKQKLDFIDEGLEKKEYELGVEYDEGEGKITEMPTKDLDLANITDEEFLEIPEMERLQHITKNNIDSDKIANGEVQEIDFTFALKGELIEDLGKSIALAQVLPREVRTIESGGKIYERKGLKGDFFNVEDNKILTLKEGLHITVKNLSNGNEIVKMEQENKEKYNKFVADNPKFQGDKYRTIIDSAIEKGIDGKILLSVAERRIENFDQKNNFKSTDIEKITTDVSKTFSGEKVEYGNQLTLEFLMKILRLLVPTTYGEVAKKYGYSSDEIREYDEKHPDTYKYDIGNFDSNNFSPAEFSVPAERSKFGTTLCSRTARKNLSRLGVKNPTQGSSAKESYALSGSPTGLFPPKGDTEAKVADLYLDASSKNKQWGHRVACFKGNDGNWYVLDPYYNGIPGKKSPTAPVLAENYIHYMKNSKGRRIWGAKFF